MSSSLINITSTSGALKEAAKNKQYWRSLDDYAGTPQFQEFVEREFPTNASELLSGESRRTVLKLMGASFGLAGLTACTRPVEHILPNAKGVDDYVPGQAYYYATVYSMGGHTSGLLVEAHDGRPTKIEGNTEHPSSLGAATALTQASLLNLYDPDRSAKVMNGSAESTWDKFDAFVTDLMRGLSPGDGSQLRVLSETVTSPSLAALRAEMMKKYPKAKWVEYESFNRDNEFMGAEMAFGPGVYARPQFDKAKVILALDFDFLGLDFPAPVATKRFTQTRRVETEEDLEKMSRMYAVESQFSLTGANADHRLRMKGGDVKQFAFDLAAALGAIPGLNVVNNGVNNGSDKRSKFLAALVKDLKAAGSGALVAAGPRQPAIVHAVAYVINQSLGSMGTTMTLAKRVVPQSTGSSLDELKSLVGEMNGGQVSTLFILGGNPVYTAPVDLGFGAALAKVANSIHLGTDDSETAAAAKWHIPEAHFLESWGDAATIYGTSAIQQPLIAPIFGGRTASETVARLIDSKDKKAYDIVKNYWLNEWTSSVKDANAREMAWRKALHDGIIAGAPVVEVKGALDSKRVAAAVAAEAKAQAAGFEVAFVPSASCWDGRYANNGWMQEAPDPVTKLVWGNALLVSPATAKAKSWSDGDVVTISKGSYKLEAAVLVQPGHADDSATVSLGYGRAKVGRVGTDVGFNAGAIRTSDGFWYGSGYDITSAGKRHVHASTQEHGYIGGLMDTGRADKLNDRPVFRETTIEEYKKNPKVIEEMNEVPELHSIYPEWTYDKGYQWGLSIDLSACTGCNACVVACTSENNIPVVGKEQVLHGREMHWIRMDRYYVGDENDPRMVEQPLPCMQCENAPCENVCPVAATTHSPEGLNDMVYNRCVGTRYCANNCPFKVRHFNFLNFHKHDPPIMGMAHNPDVTVRMRGVMEKCTYCVQRIQETRIKAKQDGRRAIKDGEIQTACQQTCPADAIVFGNINDPNSRVSKLKRQERNYAMLAELDIKPRTTYLGRLRNPNPELEA
jgi:molybdopterin-containing oxidoreductase family iron-sulfur binding subunit